MQDRGPSAAPTGLGATSPRSSAHSQTHSLLPVPPGRRERRTHEKEQLVATNTVFREPIRPTAESRWGELKAGLETEIVEHGLHLNLMSEVTVNKMAAVNEATKRNYGNRGFP